MSTITDYMRSSTYGWIFVGMSGVGLYLLYRRRGLPPGPTGWPLIGAAKEVSGEMHLDCVKLGEKYGNIFSYYSWGKLYVVLNDLESAREGFLKLGEDLSHRTPANGIKLMGIFDEIMYQPFCDQWKADRRFALTTLRSCGFGTKQGEGRILKALDSLAEYLQIRRTGGDRYSSSGTYQVDPREFSTLISGSVILGILLGEERNLDDPVLMEFIHEIAAWWSARFPPEAALIDELPLWLCPWLFPKTCGTMFKAAERLRARYRAAIDRHVSESAAETTVDVIAGYLKARPGHHHDLLANNFMVFTIDAVHTMSTVMVTTLFYLCSHPDEQEKVRGQIRGVAGGRHVTTGDKPLLPLLEAALCETLRLLSPVTMALPRTAPRDFYLHDFRIPKGALVTANYYNIHMDPKHFPKPQHFSLDHFLDSSGALRRTEALVPFGIGRRSCPGEQLARQELFIVLANLLNRYIFTFPKDFTPPSDDKVATDQNITRAPALFDVVMKVE